MVNGEVPGKPSPASAGSFPASFPSVLFSASGFSFSTSVLLGKDRVEGGKATVDGRNPAPVDKENMLDFKGF